MICNFTMFWTVPPEVFIKLVLSTYSIISHLNKCTCPAFMTYHLSFKTATPYFLNKLMQNRCAFSIKKHNYSGRLWGGILAQTIYLLNLGRYGLCKKPPNYLSMILSQLKCGAFLNFVFNNVLNVFRSWWCTLSFSYLNSCSFPFPKLYTDLNLAFLQLK